MLSRTQLFWQYSHPPPPHPFSPRDVHLGIPRMKVILKNKVKDRKRVILKPHVHTFYILNFRGQCGIDKWHAKELQRQLRSKFKSSQQETLEKLLNGQDMFLFSQQRWENLNLLVPEPRVTMSITSQPCQVDKLKTKH